MSEIDTTRYFECARCGQSNSLIYRAYLPGGITVCPDCYEWESSFFRKMIGRQVGFVIWWMKSHKYTDDEVSSYLSVSRSTVYRRKMEYKQEVTKSLSV